MAMADTSQRSLAVSGRERFHLSRVLADTLQGRVYAATDKRTGEQAIVKEAFKHLVRTRRSREGRPCGENFLKELQTHEMLSQTDECQQYGGIPKYLDFWENEQCYFMAMECCAGGDLFAFVQQKHSEMAALAPRERGAFKRLVQRLFRDLVRALAWMHLNGVTHNDMSLENAMLSTSDDATMQAQIIDFGLALKFDNRSDRWTSTKRVGKMGYMSPETYAKEEYDCRSNDIWCLGIMLMMMHVGAPLYAVADPRREATLQYALRGRLLDVLQHWGRADLVTDEVMDLLTLMLKPEPQRITMEQLLAHPYVQLPTLDEMARVARLHRVPGLALSREPSDATTGTGSRSGDERQPMDVVRGVSIASDVSMPDVRGTSARQPSLGEGTAKVSAPRHAGRQASDSVVEMGPHDDYVVGADVGELMEEQEQEQEQAVLDPRVRAKLGACRTVMTKLRANPGNPQLMAVAKRNVRKLLREQELAEEEAPRADDARSNTLRELHDMLRDIDRFDNAASAG